MHTVCAGITIVEIWCVCSEANALYIIRLRHERKYEIRKFRPQVVDHLIPYGLELSKPFKQRLLRLLR